MRRHHRGSIEQLEEGDSSSEEDAFSALSRKKRKPNKVGSNNNDKLKHGQNYNVSQQDHLQTKQIESIDAKDDKLTVPNNTNTSSNMRHHHVSSDRAAKMNTLLEELEQSSKNVSNNNASLDQSKRPIPDKMGSFVTEEEEPFTTNLFVGNLSPLTTEEQLTELFRQFGDLYSVKIMWPRTPEEHARGRNTGFVCFMNREDAQDAMDACQERDPLRSGRRMWLQWGKNVKKIVRRGTGGITPIRKTSIDSQPKSASSVEARQGGMQIDNVVHVKSPSSMQDQTVVYNENEHSATAIQVIPPTDKKRLEFITTVASFVAKDGSILEKRLIEREATNPLFTFLNQNGDVNERIFYRWRVYSFTQGDGVDSWRTEPFLMISSGSFWIPPPLDKEKALREKMDRELKEEQIRIKQERRRKEFTTGRQVEVSNRAARENIIGQLRAEDLTYWNHMIDKKLCASRDAICEAMSFCFDKSAAAQHISRLLREALMDNRKGVSVETKIARLYLMSDILYNSQQPGVKNAFRYRDAIEDMAQDVFQCLGTHGVGTVGRITMNKLRNAVKAVLEAWGKWSVYNVVFLQQLEDLFEGRPIKKEIENTVEDKQSDNVESIRINQHTDMEQVGDVKNGLIKENKYTATSIWTDQTENVPNSIDDLDGENLDEYDVMDGLVDVDNDLDGDSLHDSDFEVG